MPRLGPRVVVAGTSSGVGKTTVATGLLAALTAGGVAVTGAKVGPDFIDPGYHGLACGRPSRNLDAWICGDDAIAPLAARAGEAADVLVVEGVMGLFDGSADGGRGSTAAVARLLDAPVLLVVDAAAMSGSVAALLHGFTTYDPTVRVAGVVLNRVGSDSHETMLREALEPVGVPVVGALRRDDSLTWRDRHLGLVPVAERSAEVLASIDKLGAVVAEHVDLDAILAVASSAPARDTAALPAAVPRVARRDPVRIAVAGGPAFSFVYPENLERLTEAGAELLPFDPARDRGLPDRTEAVYAGGGFPEVYAADLAANVPLLREVADHARQGMPIWAECGGMLWLCRSLDGHSLAGVIEADARMTSKLTLGYRTARCEADTPVAPRGTELRGHEFHYSVVEPPGAALALQGRFGRGPGGFASPTLLASYLHLHLGADPTPASLFVETIARARTGAAAGAR